MLGSERADTDCVAVPRCPCGLCPLEARQPVFVSYAASVVLTLPRVMVTTVLASSHGTHGRSALEARRGPKQAALHYY